jgi:hypothetical protein
MHLLPCVRGTLLPDPKYDKVRCITVATCDDSEEVPAGNYTARVLMFVDKGADASARPPDGLHEIQVCCRGTNELYLAGQWLVRVFCKSAVHVFRKEHP